MATATVSKWSKWMFLTASTAVKNDVFDHFNCSWNGCFNNNYHSHFVSQFGIKVKEYPKNPITLKPRYISQFNCGQMDVFDCFNCSQNACFWPLWPSSKWMFLTALTMVEMDVFNRFDHSQNGFLITLTAVEMHAIYLIFEVGKVLSHGKSPWSQAAQDLEVQCCTSWANEKWSWIYNKWKHHKASFFCWAKLMFPTFLNIPSVHKLLQHLHTCKKLNIYLSVHMHVNINTRTTIYIS